VRYPAPFQSHPSSLLGYVLICSDCVYPTLLTGPHSAAPGCALLHACYNLAVQLFGSAFTWFRSLLYVPLFLTSSTAASYQFGTCSKTAVHAVCMLHVTAVYSSYPSTVFKRPTQGASFPFTFNVLLDYEDIRVAASVTHITHSCC
jgi:hypothetical protein